MYKEVKISNDRISAVISTCGAEFKSIRVDGREILWNGDPEFWGWQAPILFPICGGLKDGKFIYDGKEYFLKKHGFVRGAEFELEKADETSAVFLFRSSKETLEQYPFEFELRAIFTLEEATVKVDYSVRNLSAGTMYYSVGAHEAYACPEGIEEYSILFEKTEDLKATRLIGDTLGHDAETIMENTNELPLKREYFEKDALVFPNIRSRRVTLKNRATGYSMELDFESNEQLLFWTKPGAGYICIEPWCGLADYVDTDYRIEHKKAIKSLESGEERVHTHKMIFN